MRMRRVVIALDVDGVLLESRPKARGSWQDALERRWPVDRRELADAFFGPHWQSIVCGRQPLEPVLAAVLLELEWPMTAAELIGFWFEADFHLNHLVVSAALAWHRAGATLVLATNQEHRRAAYLRNRIEPILPITGVAYSGALGATKDDLGFYERARRELGIGGDSLVTLVDDDHRNVVAARAAGWSAVFFGEANRALSEVKATSSAAVERGAPLTAAGRFS